MQIRDILKAYGFNNIDENSFQRDGWAVRIDGNYFELFNDPEIDNRYYHGPLHNLEKYLNAINKNNKGL
jgi:hypothetical protein